jgi:hypothetical protein
MKKIDNEAPMHQGPAPEPRVADISLPPAEHVANPNELEAPSPGEGWQSGMQESNPPQAPQSAAETAELKQKLGQALQAIGELKRENAEKAMDAEVEKALASARPPKTPPMDLSQFPQEKLNEPLTVQEFMIALQEMFPKLVAEAQASAMRGTWDVTPEEQAAALTRYPQLSQMQEGSSEQLTAIKRVVDVMRSSAQPAQAAPSAPAATAQPTRTPQRVAPMVEQSSPSEMPDGGGLNELGKARADYEKAKLIENSTKRVKAMRAAFDRIKALQGVSQESIHASAWRNSS